MVQSKIRIIVGESAKLLEDKINQAIQEEEAQDFEFIRSRDIPSEAYYLLELTFRKSIILQIPEGWAIAGPNAGSQM